MHSCPWDLMSVLSMCHGWLIFEIILLTKKTCKTLSIVSQIRNIPRPGWTTNFWWCFANFLVGATARKEFIVVWDGNRFIKNYLKMEFRRFQGPGQYCWAVFQELQIWEKGRYKWNGFITLYSRRFWKIEIHVVTIIGIGDCQKQNKSDQVACSVCQQLGQERFRARLAIWQG